MAVAVAAAMEAVAAAMAAAEAVAAAMAAAVAMVAVLTAVMAPTQATVVEDLRMEVPQRQVRVEALLAVSRRAASKI